jgi:hypothetical protein
MVDDTPSPDHQATTSRRRSFVAGGTRLPSPPDPAESQPDLPVLTDVVDPAAAPSQPEASEPSIPPERIEALARAMLAEVLPQRQLQAAEALNAWLDGELPQIVMQVVDGLTDHIVAQVTANVRASLVPAVEAALDEVRAAPDEAE